MAMSKRFLPKSRSVDDMDEVIAPDKEPQSPDKPPAKEIDPKINLLANTHLGMIASRARNVQRKHKKMKSRLGITRLH